VSVALAAAPVLVVLAALLLRRPAWQAAAAGLTVLAATSWLADRPVADPGGTAARSAVLVLEVGLVLLGGLALAEVGRRRGFPDAVTSYIAASGAARPAVVLLVVLGLTPFAESVTGFGVGAVIAAPILLALGLRPQPAAVVALLGLCTVPWGALAPGTLVAAALTGLDPDALGVASAAASLPVFLVVGGAAVLISDGRRAALRHAPDLVAVAMALAAGILLANLAIGTPPAGAVGALVGTGVAAAVLRLRSGRPLPPARPVLRSAAPYLLLLLGLIAGRAAGALLDPHPAAALLGSPATWLLLVSVLFLRAAEWPGVLRSWAPVAVVTTAFLVLGALLTATGQAAELGRAAAATLGIAYPAIAPWLGGLGGYLTGSNAGANAMLAAAQAEAAAGLGLSVLTLVTVQNVSASLLTMASPARVAMAATVTGVTGQAGAITARLLAVDAVALLVLTIGSVLLA
jgi:lactate permease